MDGEGDITIRGELSDDLDSGKLIVIAFVFYSPAENCLTFKFPSTITAEEGTAMLRKYHCLPASVRG
jgi:hypothetical protein